MVHIRPLERVMIGDSSRYLAFPSAASDGHTILATWANMSDHYGTANDSVGAMALSTDGGASWGNVQLIPNSPVGNTPVAVTTLHGRWAMLQMSKGPYVGYVAVTSDPLVWPTATQVDWQTAKWKFPSDLLWLDNGTSDGLLLATAYGGDGILITASHDAGKTWARWSTPETEEWSGGFGFAEPRLCVTGRGDLLILIREDREGYSQIVARNSTDLGKTWSARRVAYQGTGQPDVRLMADGTLIATVRDQTPDSTPESWALAVSEDHGDTWSTQHLVDDWMMYGVTIPTGPSTAVVIGASQQRGVATNSDVWALHIRMMPANPALLTGIHAKPEERWFIGSFITGEVKAELKPLEGSSWEQEMGQSQITAVTAVDEMVQSLLPHLIPWRDYIAVTIGDEIVAAGPYLSDAYSAEQGKLTFTARGADAYLARREVMPKAAAENWFILYDKAKRAPFSYARSSWTATWPEIGAAAVRQALTWVGMDPYARESPNIVVPAPVAYGERATYTTDGVKHVSLTSLLDEMSDRADGCEWELRPQWKGGTSSSGVIEWRLLMGRPQLTTGRLAAWSHDRVHNLATARDGSKMATLLHLTGGRSIDEPLSRTIASAGSLLCLETLDSSYSHVETWDELTQIGNERIAYDGRPRLSVSFDVPIDTLPLWRPGDFALLTGDPEASLEWQARVPHLAAESRLRIVGRSARAGADMVRVHTQHLAPEDSDAWLSASA